MHQDKTHRPGAIISIALMLGPMCDTAHANVIVPLPLGVTLEYGPVILVVSFLIEAMLYRVLLPLGWYGEGGLPGAVGVSALANLTSTIAGLIAAFSFPLFIESSRSVLAIVFVICFLASSLIEAPIVWLRVKTVPRCRLGRTIPVVVLANAASYMLIGGLAVIHG